VRPIAPDTIVDGRYRILRRLGAGGMAEVWAAEDQQLGRHVALKLLASRFAEDPDFRERFRREASAAAGMQHPNIVSIYDRGEWDGTPYIAMELVAGKTLKELVRETGPLAPGVATDLAIQILKALRYAHKRGLVHRDIKPQNVILDDEGQAKVADFGIARAGPSDMTEAGAMLGTVQYLSPEQAQGQPVSARSDLYSVGIVLYEMLTGRLPFDGEAPVSIALKQVSERPVPPSQLRPGIPPALEAVVLRALEKDPARRFGGADEFIAALEAARRTPLRPVVHDPTPGERWAPVDDLDERGSRWWIWLLVLLLLAAGAAGAYVLRGGTGKQVEVPSVVKERSADAASKVHAAGLEVTIVQENSKKTVDTVISQDPEAGASVKKGSNVTLHVSAGPGTAVVPAVAGLKQADAEQNLKESGFNEKLKHAYSDTVPAGTVIGSSPAEGTEITKGRFVTLTVSRGKQVVTVPKLTGLAQADAEKALSDLGLQADETQQETTKPPGTVIAQDPAANGTVDKGGTVKLTIAKQRPQVPDVTKGNPLQADAEQTLTDAGFKVKVRETPPPAPELAGHVLSQSPAGGERRSTGATVTITVGQAPADATPTPTPTATQAPGA
jgi:beta-lactam-binding protein with PASTA domain